MPRGARGFKSRNIPDKWRVRWDPKMAAYRNAILSISARFEGLEFHHVARESNQAADILARMGAKRDPVPPNTCMERLFKPSVVWQGKNREDSADLVTPPASA